MITNGTDHSNAVSLEIYNDISLQDLLRYRSGVVLSMIEEGHIQRRHGDKWSRSKERKAE